ncbi:MAG: hypothetical protein H7245_24740 [Candidatus Saccharibacteria bacterium]|nr:hypothetical protein [Pseudorhodobacter sp.]
MSLSIVLTGDLIGSTEVEPSVVDLAMTCLSSAASTIADWTGNDTRFTRFRGDGWQIILSDPPLVLRATLLILASLRAKGGGLATRLSVATGTVDRLGDRGLAEASGPAFTLSGRNLDTMPPFRTFVYAALDRDQRWTIAIMDLAVWQAQQWTPEQAEAAMLALDLPRRTDKVLAAQLGISRQAFQSRIKGTGLMAMRSALHAFELERKTTER